MNPIRLRAENFLSYGSIDLDLSGVSIAAIVGENGAGKSSLLDMLTWAFYGNGRYSSIDDYIRQGQEQATVEHEFELSGKTYRVIRTRSNKSKGKSTLELAEKDGYAWKTLTGTTIAETQRKIIDLLRMDYNTFISTCFILQKQSDKFSAATPGERKTVLGKALGLDYYEKLIELAKAKAKEFNQRLARYEMEIELLQNATQGKSEMEAEKGRLQAEMTEMAEGQKMLQQFIRELEDEKRAIENQLNEMGSLRQRKKDLKKRADEISVFITEIAEKQLLIKSNDGLFSLISTKEAERQAAQQTLDMYQKSLTEQTVIIGKAVDIKAAIEKAQMQQLELTSEYSNIQKKLERYDKIVANAEMVRSKAELYDQLKEEMHALDQKQSQYRKLKDKAQGLEAKVAAFDKEQKSAIERIDALIEQAEKQVTLLNKVPCSEDMQGMCPLLQNAIAARKEIKRLTLEKNKWDKKPNPYANEWQAVCEERDAVGYDEARHYDVTMQAVELEPFAKLLPELEHAEEAITDLKKQDAVNQQKALDIAQELAHLQKELGHVKIAKEKAAGYEKMVAETKGKIQRLDSEITALRENQAKAIAHKEQLERMLKDLPAKEEELFSIEMEISDIDDKLKNIEKIEAEKTVKERTIKQRQDEWNAVMQTIGEHQAQLGKVDAKLDDIKKAEAQKAEKEAKIKAIAHEVYLYETLVKAFGKNGIPALIIENALPDIETIANDLLNALTGGRMMVQLVTQKETKTAGISETLDIIISDELGPRPYEGWSGAESYEVDIALRVAISKFLAKRAGASMKTLVIDEGLGSLDAQGKQKFIEAVNTLAGDFEKVLCISHIDEIKEAFPQQIVVRKTPVGSIADVV